MFDPKNHENVKKKDEPQVKDITIGDQRRRRPQIKYLGHNSCDENYYRF